MKWLAVVALAAAFGVSLTYLVWQPGGNDAEKGPAGIRLEPGGSSMIEGIGYVEPASEVRQLSPKSGGVIKACYTPHVVK